MSDEVARLKGVIEHDRSKVADILAEANAILKGYGWLADGRGSYAFDDDRWKDEFSTCIGKLKSALDPMRVIAGDLSDSPVKWADIEAARASKPEAGSVEGLEQAARWHDAERMRLIKRREENKDEWAKNGYDAIISNSIRQHEVSAEAIRNLTAAPGAVVDDGMVERVAKAIYAAKYPAKSWELESHEVNNVVRNQARAAIAAINGGK